MANFSFLITGHVIDKIVNQCAKPQYNTPQRLYRKHKKHTEDNKAHRKQRHSEADVYSLNRGK